MAKEFGRNVRVGGMIGRELSQLIQMEMKDPRIGIVTIPEVRVSQDLAHAKVYVTSLAGVSKDTDTVCFLNKAASSLRRELSRRLRLRIVPNLHFVYDVSLERGAAMDALIADSIAADRHSGTKE